MLVLIVTRSVTILCGPLWAHPVFRLSLKIINSALGFPGLRIGNFTGIYVEGGQDEMATALKCAMNMCGTSSMALMIQVKQGKDS